MNIRITNGSGTFDITELVPAVKWSGEYQQAARSLGCEVLTSSTDKNIPAVDLPLGASIQLIENGEALFDGFVMSRTKSTEGNTLSLSCYDRGFYLKRNRAIYNFTSPAMTPEAATRRIAAEFGISLGAVADTGIAISRCFLGGKDSLYDIILTMYTLASKESGKQYHIGFRGKNLYVTVKEPDDRTLVIQGESNLIAAATTESIDKMVNAVKIYDANSKYVREVQDAAAIKLYGRMQEIVKQTKNDNKASEAQKLLNEGGISQKMTVDCLGNIANVTGGTVVVQEPYTGICGLFYIDGDEHEWKRGQYYNRLILNFKNIMNAKEAGDLPNATGKNTAAGSKSITYFDYQYRPMTE